MGQDIHIHGSGDNYRPTLCALDAIRAMRFLAMKPEASREIFHLIGNNYRIREIATEVKSVFPNIKIEHILKEVPFNSYHLSSDKIKTLGFGFEWDIRRGIEEMKTIFSALYCNK